MAKGALVPNGATPDVHLATSPTLAWAATAGALHASLHSSRLFCSCDLQMMPYTGHVTMGGSICIEALTTRWACVHG